MVGHKIISSVHNVSLFTSFISITAKSSIGLFDLKCI